MKEYVTAWEGHEPIVQGEEIVRCRVCRHFNGHHGKCHRQRGGVLIDDRSTRRLEDLGDVLVLNDAEPNGFCSWGERRVGRMTVSITDSQEPSYRLEREIDMVGMGMRIRDLEGQVDALGELAADMARDLEDAPRGAWYAKRLRALIGGR